MTGSITPKGHSLQPFLLAALFDERNSGRMSAKDELGKMVRSLGQSPVWRALIGATSCSADLLERVFLRLGHADTDEQLEKNVGRFLAPVLLKMASPHKEVKDKVRGTQKASCLQDMIKMYMLLP